MSKHTIRRIEKRWEDGESTANDVGYLLDQLATLSANDVEMLRSIADEYTNRRSAPWTFLRGLARRINDIAIGDDPAL